MKRAIAAGDDDKIVERVEIEFADGKRVSESGHGMTVHDVEWYWNDGNGGCDCNRSIIRREPDVPCGATIKLASLTAILPDGTELALSTEPV